MQDPAETLVPIIAILVIFGMPLAYAIMNRVFAHHERIELIKRGITPPPDPKWARRAWRQFDQTAQQQQGVPYDPYYGYSQFQANKQLRGGVTLAMIGLALLIGLSFIDGIVGFPGPWLLGGLIPLFAGIAQIILALLAGARLGPMGYGGPPPAPGIGESSEHYQQAPPYTEPRNVSPGPYAWRPGPTTELERPAPPPDVK